MSKSSGAVYLVDLLKNVLKNEQMSGDNRFNCLKCHNLMNATLSRTVTALPLFLNINLNRFQYVSYLAARRKLS